MEKIKVMIVEDQIIFRKGLKLVLSDMEQVELMEEADNGKEFLEIIKKTMADVILMDVQMPVMDGVEATKAAVALYPDIKILVISIHGEEENLIRMLEAGARGFLLKNTDEDDLKKAILTVYAGKNYFSNDLLPALTSAYMKKKTYTEEKNDIYEKLTKREIEVLKYICMGYTNKEIAEACFISFRTVGGHRESLLAKTGCRNTAQLVSFGIKYNLIN
jgi:DNA-binding NarL/FixJ family response regulator